MMDDIDREVCSFVEKNLQLGPGLTIEKRVFNDPGMDLHVLVHKGTACEMKATISVTYGHKEGK